MSKPADTTLPIRASTGQAKSVISSDLKITGEVTSTGAVEITGEVDGNVAAQTLSLGTEGRIKGTVKADTLEIKGQLDGKLAADTLTLRASATVQADVNYSTLVIESGARLEGNLTRKKG